MMLLIKGALCVSMLVGECRSRGLWGGGGGNGVRLFCSVWEKGREEDLRTEVPHTRVGNLEMWPRTGRLGDRKRAWRLGLWRFPGTAALGAG